MPNAAEITQLARTPTSWAMRKSSVEARSWMPSVVRLISSVMPSEQDDRDDPGHDLELRDQHAADVELRRQPGVRLDALLDARPDGHPAQPPRARS